MVKTSDQFHFSLLEREQADLLEPRRTRDEWLRHTFAERFQFTHHANQFWWVPQNFSPSYIVGVVERERFQTERTPPSEGAKEIEGSFWTGAMVIIDPRDMPGGQAVAVENKNDVGDPNAVLESLAAHLNAFHEKQYVLLFKALFEGGSFRRFAEKHGGQLAYVRFRFTVPNMIFGAGDGVKKGLRRIAKDTEAQEIEIKLESKDGIKADSEAVREGLAYGEEGNAIVTAKALDGERWSSTKRKLRSKLKAILDLPKATAEEVQAWLKQALDRGAHTLDSDADPADGGAGSN